MSGHCAGNQQGLCQQQNPLYSLLLLHVPRCLVEDAVGQQKSSTRCSKSDDPASPSFVICHVRPRMVSTRKRLAAVIICRFSYTPRILEWSNPAVNAMKRPL